VENEAKFHSVQRPESLGMGKRLAGKDHVALEPGDEGHIEARQTDSACTHTQP
jgi:hypothetical protein